MTPRIAVHLHLYYTNMWESVKAHLNNIAATPYDLYVTLTEPNDALIEQIKNYHTGAQIFIVENRGFDIGPFVHVLNAIELNNYDIIIKLHTKSTAKAPLTLLNGRYIDKQTWSALLWGGILGSTKLFNKNINAFQTNKTLGMIGSRYLITDAPDVSKNVAPLVCGIMQKMGYQAPQHIKFVAGSSFMCRAHLLQPIKEHFSLTDFEPSNPTQKDGAPAHAFERVFGCLIEAQGFTIQGFDKNKQLEHKHIAHKTSNPIKRFFYQRKKTKNNHVLIKVCKIPVFYKKTFNKNISGDEIR